MPQYLKNSELLKEVVKSKELGKLTPIAVEQFQLMVDKIGLEFRYKDRMDAEDCKSEAMLNVLKYWKTFDETRTKNAFSYFTEVIKTGYGIGYNRLYKKNLKTISINMVEHINNI